MTLTPKITLITTLLILFGCVVGCSEETEPTPACACTQRDCPDDRCNVKVTLGESCRETVGQARVYVNGVDEGVVSVGEPYYSCASWKEGESGEVFARNTDANFQSYTLTANCLLGGSSVSFPIDCVQ